MRLIDADRLEAAMSETIMAIMRNPKMDTQEAHLHAAFHTFGRMLCNERVVDAVPVKHGEWIVKGQDIFCSVCGEESAYTWSGASKFSNYCPNCGAKMDERKDDETD